MDAARPETTLCDLEATALAEQNAVDRDVHVFEKHFHVPVRRVVVSENLQRPQHGDTRRVARHQHHRLLLMTRGCRVGLAHDDEDLAMRMTGARAIPLAAVDDVLVALANDAALNVGRIGRGDGRLGHEERGPDLTGE